MPGILPYPPFKRRRRGDVDLADIGGSVGGIAALTPDLNINGVTVLPTFRYEGKNATTGLWTATLGQNLTGQGSGGIVALDTPLISSDQAATGDSSRSWVADDNDFADVTTEDLIIETYFRTGALTGTAAIVAKWSAAGGYLLYTNGTNLNFQLRYGAIASATCTATGLNPYTWYHAIVFAHRAGSSVAYVNTNVGSPISNAAIVTATNTGQPLGIGSVYLSETQVVYAAAWIRNAWLDTHLQAAVAEDRYAKLNGTWAPVFKKAPTQSFLRNSVATLEKQGKDGGQKIFTVGARWPRFEKRPDKHLRYKSGYFPESQHTNLFTYSEDFTNAAWFALNITRDLNDTLAPNNELNGCKITESATTGRQYLEDQIGTAIDTYTAGIFVKPSGREHFYIKIYSTVDGTAECWFDLSNGVLTQLTGIDEPYFRYLGNGWFHAAMADTRASIETKTVRYGFGSAPGVDSYAGDGRVCGWIFGAQATATDYPVSYIKAAGAPTTRLSDGLVYDGLPLPAGGTIACDYLSNHAKAATLARLGSVNDGGSSDRRLIYRASTSTFMFAAAGGISQVLAGGSNLIKPYTWQELRFTCATDDAEFYLDGVSKATDPTVTLPTGLTRLSVGCAYDGTLAAEGLVRLRLYSKPTLKLVTDFGVIMAQASGYISASSPIVQSTAYANVGGTFTAVHLTDFTLSAAGVFTYTGADTKRFVVSAACSGSIDSGTPKITTVIEKNGVAVTSSEEERKVTTTNVGAWPIQGNVELANGDTVNFATKVDTGTPNLTMTKLSVVIHEAA